MPTLRDPVPAAYRFLVLDPDTDRGGLIALRARAGGHAICQALDLDGARSRLLAEPWDAVGIEVMAGPLPSSFALRELQVALRRAAVRMPPTLIYVRGTLARSRAVIERMLDEVVPGVERVASDDPDAVVRALERLAAGRRPAAIPIVEDGRAAGTGAPGGMRAVAQPGAGAAATAGPSDAAIPSGGGASPASNWRR